MHELENRKKATLFSLASLIVILLTFLAMRVSAKGQKLDKNSIAATATNADILFPPTSSDTESVCVEIWKGVDGNIKHGEHLRVHSLQDTFFVGPDDVKLWADVCLDSSPKAWGRFQPSVQVWKKGQKEKFLNDSGNRYVINFSDVTKSQRDKLKDTNSKIVSLGNYRLVKEAKK